MSSQKGLLFFLALVIVATVAFVTMTGPLPINGLTAIVRNPLAANSDRPTAVTVDQSRAVKRYRMQLTVNSFGTDEWPSHITGEGAYIVKPRSEVVTLHYTESTDDNAETHAVTMTVVDGAYYLQDGDLVMQTPGPAINLQELTLVTPKDATDLSHGFVTLGEESINGRTATHYQGDPKAIPSDGTIDLSRLDTATIDLWVDTTANFIVAMELRAFGINGNPEAMYEMRIDYRDFNAEDIVVTAPELSTPRIENFTPPQP